MPAGDTGADVVAAGSPPDCQPWCGRDVVAQLPIPILRSRCIGGLSALVRRLGGGAAPRSAARSRSAADVTDPRCRQSSPCRPGLRLVASRSVVFPRHPAPHSPQSYGKARGVRIAPVTLAFPPVGRMIPWQAVSSHGATGYTGRLTAESLARRSRSSIVSPARSEGSAIG